MKISKSLCAALAAMLVLSACSSAEPTTESAPESTVESTVESATESDAESAPVSSAESVEASPEQLDESIKTELDSLAEEYEFEGVVYISKGGFNAYTFTKGEVECGESISQELPMPVGSLSKQFCAAVVMQLCEEGKLSLDDTLDNFYHDYEKGAAVTVEQLLSMRSGVPEMMGSKPVTDSLESGAQDVTDGVLKWIYEQPLDFEPDTKMSYSNTNYFLLANIAEKAGGQSYAELLHKRIFEPLSMNSSGTIYELGDSPAWAHGASYDELAELDYPGLAKGAGDVVSSAEDIDKWLTAFCGGKVVSAESFELMTTDKTSEADSYGFGFSTDVKGGFGHSGAIMPYSAYDYRNDGEALDIIVIGNAISPDDTQFFALDIIDTVVE